MKKIVGNVSKKECKEIEELFERKNGLIELSKVISIDNDIYEKLISDMGATSVRFQNWWDNMSKKYNWESTENGHWEIDFNTGDIYLIEN